MEARIYFSRKAVLNRLKKNQVPIIGEEKLNFHISSYGNLKVNGDDTDNRYAYLKITEYTELEIHPFLKGLKIYKVTLYETLSKEENLHIKQGAGTEGKSRWSVNYGDERFNPPTGSLHGCSEAYRSVIRIRINGTDLQSAKDCYKKIRRGEMPAKWKGETDIPSHCGLSNIPAELQY